MELPSNLLFQHALWYCLCLALSLHLPPSLLSRSHVDKRVCLDLAESSLLLSMLHLTPHYRLPQSHLSFIFALIQVFSCTALGLDSRGKKAKWLMVSMQN